MCPQCGTSANVHSIQELAGMARARLGELQQGYPGNQPGYAGNPQQGPLPGWAQQPQAGPPPGPGGAPAARRYRQNLGSGADLGDDLAGLAMGAAAGFVGRAISRRLQQRVVQAQSAVAGRGEQMLRTQIEIADRHPDVCACLNDGVIFLAGGQRTLPMPDLTTLTVEQADNLVAMLRAG